jgi:hypothetical protein
MSPGGGRRWSDSGAVGWVGGGGQGGREYCWFSPLAPSGREQGGGGGGGRAACMRTSSGWHAGCTYVPGHPRGAVPPGPWTPTHPPGHREHVARDISAATAPAPLAACPGSCALGATAGGWRPHMHPCVRRPGRPRCRHPGRRHRHGCCWRHRHHHGCRRCCCCCGFGRRCSSRRQRRLWAGGWWRRRHCRRRCRRRHHHHGCCCRCCCHSWHRCSSRLPRQAQGPAGGCWRQQHPGATSAARQGRPWAMQQLHLHCRSCLVVAAHQHVHHCRKLQVIGAG